MCLRLLLCASHINKFRWALARGKSCVEQSSASLISWKRQSKTTNLDVASQINWCSGNLKTVDVIWATYNVKDHVSRKSSTWRAAASSSWDAVVPLYKSLYLLRIRQCVSAHRRKCAWSLTRGIRKIRWNSTIYQTWGQYCGHPVAWLKLCRP